MRKVKKTPTPPSQETPAPPYEMTPVESEIVRKRAAERSRESPRMKAYPNGHVGPDHPDPRVGYHLIFEEIGVGWEFGLQLIDQLALATKRNGEVDLSKLNFLLSFIKSLKPRDALEVSLISQTALAQLRCMEAGQHTAAVTDPDWRERHERRLLQLMRTFVLQTQALKHYRSEGARQTVVVQHMTLTRDSQAPMGDASKHEHSQQAPALPHEMRAPMPVIEGTPPQSLRASLKVANE